MSKTFNEQEVAAIRRMYPDLRQADFDLFLMTAQAMGLDPLRKQLYALLRNVKNKKTDSWESKMTIQTSIDGYRSIAARSGLHAGTSDAIYGSEANGRPTSATVTVMKCLPNGQVGKFVATARWKEYAQDSSMWAKMPYHMLGKVAEALALRKAFPDELGGVYTVEELPPAASSDASLAQIPDDTLLSAPVDAATGEVKVTPPDASPVAAAGSGDATPTRQADPSDAVVYLTSQQTRAIKEHWIRIYGNLRVAENNARALEHLQEKTGKKKGSDLTKAEADSYLKILADTQGQESLFAASEPSSEAQ